jgi:hypothetical protein
MTIAKITEFPLKRFIYSFYSQSEIDHVVYGRDMKEEEKDTWWKENYYGVWKDFRNPKSPWTLITNEISIMDCHHHGTDGYRSPWMCGDATSLPDWCFDEDREVS